MAKYRYAGPNPHEDAELGLIRPLDEREFEAEPDFGPWELLPEEAEDEAPEADQAAEKPVTETAATPSLPSLTTPVKEF